MAITYPLTLPASPGPKDLRITAVSSVGMSISPWTFTENVQAHAGQRWEMDFSLPPMTKDDAQTWLAFILSLNGMEGTFLAGDQSMGTPRGPMGGSPLIKGAGQTGTTLAIDGCTISQTPWAKAGDYIQLGTGSTSRLHRVLQDANSDGSGNVSLDLWPRVRTAPADNSAVGKLNTVGLWRLASSRNAWTVSDFMFHAIVIVAVEAL